MNQNASNRKAKKKKEDAIKKARRAGQIYLLGEN